MKKPKQTKAKKTGTPRKAAKTAVIAKTPKVLRTRERDPRLPAAGTVIVRTYKGKDHRVKVLEDSLELDGNEYRSMTALARAVTGYAAISCPAWLGLTKEKGATPTPDAAKETPTVPVKVRAPKRAAKTRRAGRDAQIPATIDVVPKATSAAENATV